MLIRVGIGGVGVGKPSASSDARGYGPVAYVAKASGAVAGVAAVGVEEMLRTMAAQMWKVVRAASSEGVHVLADDFGSNRPYTEHGRLHALSGATALADRRAQVLNHFYSGGVSSIACFAELVLVFHEL